MSSAVGERELVEELLVVVTQLSCVLDEFRFHFSSLLGQCRFHVLAPLFCY